MNSGEQALSKVKSGKGGQLLATTTLVIVAAIVVVGLTLGKRLWVHDNIHVPLQRRAAAFTAELKAQGKEVGEPRLAAAAPGIKQIIILDVAGQPVRLLEFDPSVEADAKLLKQIHDEHKIHIFGVDQPAEDEGEIVIIDFENHPLQKEIIEAFHKKAGSP